MQDADAFLAARVLHEKQVVTYRLLSRTLGLDVDASKAYVPFDSRSAMLAWYEAQGAAALPIYTVRGIRKDAPVLGHERVETLALVDGNKLAALYTSQSYQMYALQASPTYDAPLLAAVNREITHDPALMERWGGDATALGVIANQHTPRTGPVSVAARRAPPAAAPPKQERPDDEPVVSDTGRVRKRRKVIKKVKTKNEKGYTITRDVEEYESYSEDESEAPTAPAAPAAPAARPPAPKSKAKGKPQQPSLTSFFTKQPR